MISGEASDWTVEFQTANGDWQLALAGRKWKSEVAASRAMQKWVERQCRECSWEPATRVIPLFKSYNARLRASLVSA